MRRVVISGIGAVTALGTGWRNLWPNLLAGKDAIGDVSSFDTSAYRVHRGAEITDFSEQVSTWFEVPRQLGRATRFALGATVDALADAGIRPDSMPGERMGVAMGTTSGEPREIERFNDNQMAGHLERVGGEFMSVYPCHGIPATLAAAFGFAAVAPLMIPTACAAGNYAIAHAFETVRQGRADLMIAGGSDAFSRITYTGFARLMAISPEKCRPFSNGRKGMVPGEGSGVLVLETAASAKARGATIYAEIAGYGFSCDAYHMTGAHPEGRGAMSAMSMALKMSGMDPTDVDYISAHGTGTPSNDLNETTAVKNVFGEHAYEVPISSVKSMLGHTMGAASAIETGVCALTIAEGKIPPTINLDEPDPKCDLDYVPNTSRDHKVRVAMNNAYAFGGTNGSLILKKFED